MHTELLSIRPLTPDDGDAVDLVFAGLSPRSRYLRFHAPMPRLPAAMRRGLLHLRGDDRMALLAEVATGGGRVPVGIARVGRTGPGEGELSVAVVDDWQGLGVGRRLLVALRELAVGAGYRRLHGLVLPGNARVLHLLDEVFPGAARREEDGVIQVNCPLPHLVPHHV